MISAVIMASGFGRRMGTNKLLLPYKGKYLVEHIIEIVSQYNFHEKIIVARDDIVLELAKRKGFIAIKNNRAYIGQSQSIKLALQCALKTEGYIFFTADQPFIDNQTIKLLVYSFTMNSKSIIVPKHGNRKGSPVIFPLKFVDELKNLEGDNGGGKVMNSHREDIVFVEIKNELSLMDIDTREDYRRLIVTKE
jgi:molybdenum cofactor cytidylyltransferase